MTFKILSCDGGGIRGIITALMIQDLISDDSGFLDTVDGFAGTSTGGLIALGLANGVSIGDIVTMYETKGSTIFKENKWLLDEKEEQAAELLGSGPGIFSCQYTNTGLEGLADTMFGSWKLNDLEKLVVVNTAQLWDNDKNSWVARTFSNAASDVNSNDFGEILLRDAALATSAAPTYFPPYKIGSYGYFADGGVFANNPAVTAIAEAISGGFATSSSDLRVLSLGTGISPVGIQPSAISNPLDWGVTHWLWPAASGTVPAMALLTLTMDATAIVADHNAAGILGPNGYMRAQALLPAPFPLDDWQNVQDLVTFMQKTYLLSPEWGDVKSWLKTNWK